jgi:caffeoyl-CoA O-methyltransferase
MGRSLGLDDDLLDYLVDVSVRESPVLARLRADTLPIAGAGMQIGVDQGAIMQMLVRLMGARRHLEIGVFTGYSALAVALALPEDGLITACDVSEEWTSIGRRHWKEAGVDHKIDLRLAPAVETLDRLLAGGAHATYDTAFIDADKTGYEAYYERALELIRPGGLIMIDNVLWDGAVADPEIHDADTDALRALNAKLRDDDRIDLCMLSVGDGLTLARRKDE